MLQLTADLGRACDAPSAQQHSAELLRSSAGTPATSPPTWELYAAEDKEPAKGIKVEKLVSTVVSKHLSPSPLLTFQGCL